MPIRDGRSSLPGETAAFRSRTGAVSVLRTARRVAANLQDGLIGPRAASAARGLRRLLGARTVGLASLSGAVEWSGSVERSRDAEWSGVVEWSGAALPEDEVRARIDDVLHTETRSGRPPLVAVPLHVRDELAGVLVVAGDVRMSAVRQAAHWAEEGLERSRLEATADQALQSELRALQAEISPHFVYNALTVIAALVRSEPDRARELMLDFADFIRYGLARHREYATVSEEFHAIETYLALQRAVIGERLRVQVRVAPEVLAVAVPYLILQPLVENAVRHGIERRAPDAGGPGFVQVLGEPEGNDLVISVEDNGLGMDPERVESILAGESDRHSVGLTNVDRRLRSVYGNWFGLVVETAEGAGTRVVVRVPMFQPGVVP